MIKNKTFTVEINTVSKRVFKLIRSAGRLININNKDNLVCTLLYTDGLISNIKTRSYLKREYKYKDEVLEGDLIVDVSDIEVQNPSYILEITIKKMWLNDNHVTGYFNVIDDTSIYITNPGDKEALKKAKATLNHLKTDFSNVRDMFDLIKYKDDTYSNYYEIDKNVYSMKKKF